MDSRRLTRAALAAGLLIAGGGCRWAWNLWARGDLARDVKSLLAREGILVKDVKCRMFGTLNSGACVFPLTAAQSTTLVAALKLRVLVPTEPIREFKGGCSDTSPFDTGFVRAYRSSALRPPELKLRDGGSFDYVYLYHHPTSGTACVQALYTPEGVALPANSMVR
ncbi:MAG TPA: hypothetical protein PLB01_06760 [Thermoanaerobaculia bacterium]|nr:hypothetical protein [Thermoanaerobaculia bacterium]